MALCPLFVGFHPSRIWSLWTCQARPSVISRHRPKHAALEFTIERWSDEPTLVKVSRQSKSQIGPDLVVEPNREVVSDIRSCPDHWRWISADLKDWLCLTGAFEVYVSSAASSIHNWSLEQGMPSYEYPKRRECLSQC